MPWFKSPSLIHSVGSSAVLVIAYPVTPTLSNIVYSKEVFEVGVIVISGSLTSLAIAVISILPITLSIWIIPAW